MRRRDILPLLGAAALCPRGAFSQSPANARVGLLGSGAPIADTSPNGVALIRGLAQHGYELGRNLAFERRGAEGHVDRLPRLVEELAASKVDVIVPPATLRPLPASRRRRCRSWRTEPGIRSAP